VPSRTNSLSAGTYDDVRKQRVFKVKRVTHRKNPVYHALVPGGLEHKVMMGMPREPTILKKVNEVCECVDVSITPGGCSWLHGVVKIRKKSEEDGRKAIEAAFKGHASMKHVVIVDEDIDILDPLDVEWAISTRVQMDKDAVIKPGEKGSSLDPSADPETRATCKVGLDATCPIADRKFYLRAEFPKVNLKELV
jgi:2,5-furandicarboxylate decarboxylase 1